jgi:hypothetical protein
MVQIFPADMPTTIAMWEWRKNAKSPLCGVFTTCPTRLLSHPVTDPAIVGGFLPDRSNIDLTNIAHQLVRLVLTPINRFNRALPSCQPMYLFA